MSEIVICDECSTRQGRSLDYVETLPGRRVCGYCGQDKRVGVYIPASYDRRR